MLYWNPYTLDISIDSGDIRNIILPSYRVGGYIDVARSLQFDFMWHYLNFLIFCVAGPPSLVLSPQVYPDTSGQRWPKAGPTVVDREFIRKNREI